MIESIIKIKNNFLEVFNNVWNKVCNFISKFRFPIIMLIVLIIAITIRYLLVPVVSHDYLVFLQPWVVYMKQHGGGIGGLIALYEAGIEPINAGGKFIGKITIDEFGEGFTTNLWACDYPPLYMYFLSMFSSFSLGPVLNNFDPNNLQLIFGASGDASGQVFQNVIYLIKSLSFVFDILLAIFSYKLVKEVSKSKVAGVIAYSVILFLPTVNFNSALWGQCDVIYAFFLVCAVYYAIKNKSLASTVYFGLSLCFKLQGIFLLPLYGFLFFRKKYNVLYLLISPLIVIASFLPLWFAGAKGSLPFMPYFGQLGGYSDRLNWNSTSIFALIDLKNLSQNAVNTYSTVGIIVMVITCFVVISILAIRKVKIDAKSILTVSTFFSILVPFLLPMMHERYFYFAEVMLVLYATINIKRIHLPIMIQIGTLMAFSNYAFINKIGGDNNLLIGASLNLIIIAFLVYDLFKLEKEEDTKSNIELKNESIQ